MRRALEKLMRIRRTRPRGADWAKPGERKKVAKFDENEISCRIAEKASPRGRSGANAFILLWHGTSVHAVPAICRTPDLQATIQCIGSLRAFSQVEVVGRCGTHWRAGHGAWRFEFTAHGISLFRPKASPKAVRRSDSMCGLGDLIAGRADRRTYHHRRSDAPRDRPRAVAGSRGVVRENEVESGSGPQIPYGPWICFCGGRLPHKAVRRSDSMGGLGAARLRAISGEQPRS